MSNVVQINMTELIDYVFRESLNDGYALTHKEIFEVLQLQKDFVEKKLEEFEHGENQCS